MVLVKISKFFIILVIVVVGSTAVFYPTFFYTPLSDKTGNLSTFYLPSTENKKSPLVVVFGGSNGGIWLQRNKYLQNFLNSNGYSALGIGFFGTEDTPEFLSRIEIGGIRELVESHFPYHYTGTCITLLGVSKGAELALLLGSLDSPDYSVIALVPSHAHYQATNISLFPLPAWTYDGEELPFVRYPIFSRETIKGIFNAPNYTEMFNQTLASSLLNEDALIKIENINAPVLLVAGASDPVWPSDKMVVELFKRGIKAKKTVSVIVSGYGHYIGNKEVYEGMQEFLSNTMSNCDVTE